MRADEFEAMRRQMVAEISAHAVQLRETIGKSAFAGPVMAAMEKVPRWRSLMHDLTACTRAISARSPNAC